jgi:hypothetical protein
MSLSWGGAERGVLAVLDWDAPCSFWGLRPNSTGEDRACGAGVCGEPVEVFVGKGFGRVAGSVDDTDGLLALEDGNG